MTNADNAQLTKEDVKAIVSESVEGLAVSIKKSFDDVYKHIDKSAAETQRKFDDVYEYIDKSAEETQWHFDVVAENIHVDVARANKDEITSIKHRVEVLEEKSGYKY